MKTSSFLFLFFIASRLFAQDAPLKVYQNYDFVAGEKILFEDNFSEDPNGEFPIHWKITNGQAVVNKVKDKPAFLLTDGNYANVFPRMKTEKYLGETFTVEFDFIFVKGKDEAYSDAIGIEFYYSVDGYEAPFRVHFGMGDVANEYHR